MRIPRSLGRPKVTGFRAADQSARPTFLSEIQHCNINPRVLEMAGDGINQESTLLF